MSGRVVVVGDLMVDVVARPDGPLARGSDAPARVRLHGGGSGANVAAWLAHTGHAPALVVRVGDDAAGREAVATLRAAGVEVHASTDPELPTGLCVVLVEPDGERTFLPDRGANAALEPGDLPEGLLQRGSHLHLSAYPLLEPAGPGRQAARAAIGQALERGATVSVDPASSALLHAVGAEPFLALIRGAGLLLPNADEAATLTGEQEPEQAAMRLAQRSGAEVVVTLGATGAVWSDGERTERAVATPVAGDSTGAGDAFAAGWLAARLDGASVPEALRAANALGAEALGVAGGRPAPVDPGPTLPAMRSFLHVARAEAWEEARRVGEYRVPDGTFTHGCYAEQLDGVLTRFYAGVPRAELVLLEIEPAGLPVKVEAADDGAGDFPHVYGPIPVASVVATLPVPS